MMVVWVVVIALRRRFYRAAAATLVRQSCVFVVPVSDWRYPALGLVQK